MWMALTRWLYMRELVFILRLLLWFLHLQTYHQGGSAHLIKECEGGLFGRLNLNHILYFIIEEYYTGDNKNKTTAYHFSWYQGNLWSGLNIQYLLGAYQPECFFVLVTLQAGNAVTRIVPASEVALQQFRFVEGNREIRAFVISALFGWTWHNP